MAQIRFKLPRDLITHLDSYTDQIGVVRSVLITELITDFLISGVETATKRVVEHLRSNRPKPATPADAKPVTLSHVPAEAARTLRIWCADLGISLSSLMQVIIHDRFSDAERLSAITTRVRTKGYQPELRIPGTDTVEEGRVAVVAPLSQQLRAGIEKIEKVESRRTGKQIEHFLTEAVDKQEEFDGPLSSPPDEGSETKLVRIDRRVHQKLRAWSRRKNRTIQEQISHVLHKAVEKYTAPEH